MAADRETTARVGCDCIALTNEALREHNTELGLSFHFSRTTGQVLSFVAIQTTLIEKRRGARPMALLPSHCPFCGARYPRMEVAAEPPAATGGAE